MEPRTSALRRSPDDTDPSERVIVANADQMVIVCSLAEPPPRLRFVDRCLVAAYDGGLEPLLVLTKADLAAKSAPGTVRAAYAGLALPMLTTRRPLPPRTLSRVRNLLTGRISVLIGQSGVGKSTLVNTLVPEAARATGVVNPVTGRGRHTSSSAVALPLGDGWLIDTPGLRGFGLGNVSLERVAEAFGDLAEGTAGCPPGCDHLSPAARWMTGPASTTRKRAWTRCAACCAAARTAPQTRRLAGAGGGIVPVPRPRTSGPALRSTEAGSEMDERAI